MSRSTTLQKGHSLASIGRTRCPTASFQTSTSAEAKLSSPPLLPERIRVNFINPQGQQLTVFAKPGDTIVDVAHAHAMDRNGMNISGACEGSLVCATCHVVLDEHHFAILGRPSEEEVDMLDLSYGVTQTSRLGCQVRMSPDLDGITVRMPVVARPTPGVATPMN